MYLCGGFFGCVCVHILMFVRVNVVVCLCVNVYKNNCMDCVV